MNPKSRLSVKYAKSVIEVNTIFAKMMENPRSDEYELLQKIKMENPGFTVSRRQIKSNPKKDTYKGLTYERMEEYITKYSANEDQKKDPGFREMEKCENQLKEKLDAEGWKTFQQFTKAQMEASSLSDCDSFISGFRLGAKVIMDGDSCHNYTS